MWGNSSPTSVARSHFSGAVSLSGSTSRSRRSPLPRKMRLAVASTWACVEQWMKPSSARDGATSSPSCWARAQPASVVMWRIVSLIAGHGNGPAGGRRFSAARRGGYPAAAVVPGGSRMPQVARGQRMPLVRSPTHSRGPMHALSLPRLAAAGAAAIALAAAAAAPAAHADSISYIKDGNIHLTTPDGSRDHQVTTAGGYSYASQADDGRIMALHGKRFQLLDQWGRVQADFSPVADGTA